MALDLETEYVNATPADAGYPYGSAKNETSVGALDGFPFEKEWFNDFIGFFQKLLTEAGITPSGVADTVLLSDYYDGLLDRISKGVNDNPIINGGCEVAQRSVLAITSAYAVGQVDNVAAKAGGTITAGDIVQSTGSIGQKGFACMIDGLTVTGAGTAAFAIRIEAKDAKAFKNKAAIFHCKVQHNTGAAINYTITISKADALNDWSTRTTISTSASLNVETGVETQIELAVATMADCSNGLQIEISAGCGAVTNKDFYITEIQLDPGAMVQPFKVKSYAQAVADCKRYFERLGEIDGDVYIRGSGAAGTVCGMIPIVEKFQRPTITKTGTWTVSNCNQPAANADYGKRGFSMIATGASGDAYFSTNSTSYVDIDGGLW